MQYVEHVAQILLVVGPALYLLWVALRAVQYFLVFAMIGACTVILWLFWPDELRRMIHGE
jgi:hypothetical protein